MRSKIRVISICLLVFMLCGLSSYVVSVSRSSVTVENQDFISVKLPLSMTPSGIPIVEMNIGSKIVHLLVDTGADWVTLSLKPSILETLGDCYYFKSKKSKDIFGKTYREKCFIIPSASLGDLELSQLIANEELRSFVPEDGIIGNGLLQQFYCLINYPAAEMILYSKDSYPAELDLASWSKLSFTHNNIGIVLKGRLGENGKQLKFCLDSGCAAIYQGKSYGIIRPRYVPKSDRITQEENMSTATEQFYLDGTDLGPMEFMVSDFKQPPVAGFIGHNIFIHYQVFIDFDKQVLYLKEA